MNPIDIKYDKIGNFIYGTRRLQRTLTTLITWFDFKNGNSSNNLGLADAEGSANLFFDKNSSLNISKLDCLNAIKGIKLLGTIPPETFNEDISKIDPYLAEIKNLYLTLAKLFREVGCTEIDPQSLEEKANSLD
jgi:hypothetical protein